MTDFLLISVLDNHHRDSKGQPAKVGTNATWHTDHTNQELPPKFTMLYAVAVPDKGGATSVCNSRAAYEALPDDVKLKIADAKTENTLISSARMKTGNPDISQPVGRWQLGEDAPLQSKRQVGLNHMAWRLESLDDLKEFYKKIKAEGQPIDHISDHGISLGIYLRDPDGNGVEVFYEMPRAEWPVDYNVFTREKTGSGRFPGPWDAEISRQGSPARPQAAAE